MSQHGEGEGAGHGSGSNLMILGKGGRCLGVPLPGRMVICGSYCISWKKPDATAGLPNRKGYWESPPSWAESAEVTSLGKFPFLGEPSQTPKVEG